MVNNLLIINRLIFKDTNDGLIILLLVWANYYLMARHHISFIISQLVIWSIAGYNYHGLLYLFIDWRLAIMVG